MGFREDMRQLREDTKKDFKKANAEFKAGHREIQAKRKEQPKQSETEKLAKTGNILIKGFALWYILPFIAVAVILMVFAGVWVWDTIMSLF